MRQMERVRGHQSGPDAADCARLLQEILTARDTLLDPQRRRIYDATSPDAVPWWQASTQPAAAPAPNPPPPAPVAAGEPWWKATAPMPEYTPPVPAAPPPSPGAGYPPPIYQPLPPEPLPAQMAPAAPAMTLPPPLPMHAP